MGYYCTVPQCTSLAGKTKNVKFHRFPRDVTMADKWNTILKRGKPYTKYSKVCSLHFTQNDYNVTTMGQWKTLSKDAVPSQNLPKLNPDGSVMVIRKSRTIKYKDAREKSEKSWSSHQHQPSVLTSVTNPLEASGALEHIDSNAAYRLQTLSAVASAMSPQSTIIKPKKQDAIMQTDPVQYEEDESQPNNSYSETSDTSYQHLDYYKDHPEKSYMTQNAKEFNKDYYKEKEWRDAPNLREDRSQMYEKNHQIYDKDQMEYQREKNQIERNNLDFQRDKNEIDRSQVDFQRDKNQGDRDQMDFQRDRNQIERNNSDFQRDRNQEDRNNLDYQREKTHIDRSHLDFQRDKNQVDRSEMDFQRDRNQIERNNLDFQKDRIPQYRDKTLDYQKNDKMDAKDDYIPTTNEEYNKEAEKYALERKNLSYEKSILDYKPMENYPKVDYLFDKGYQRDEYQLYQNNYQDSVEILRNQQHNLEILQQQHRNSDNQNFFNENHIKQEVDLNGDEEKYLYERGKEQLDANQMYRMALTQQRLDLQHVKQEPDANGCESVMQSQASPYYGTNGHTNVTSGYYEHISRPGPELLIAKQNALAAHAQLWQNTMKRPFFYSDNPPYAAPQLLHRYEDLTRILQ